jgi:hypothetical protein
MSVDHIRYDILVQEALRGMVRNVLTDTAKGGLGGDHHFFITFDTTAEGVKLSDRLRERYPEEMTIVLQHQFWDLKVTDELFEVGLSFGGVAERLVVPLAAIKAFADPSVQFTLQFETLAEAGEEADDEAEPNEAAKPKAAAVNKEAKPQERPQETKPQEAARGPARTSVPASPLPEAPSAEAGPGKPDAGPDKSGGAEVVRLDRFRKK